MKDPNRPEPGQVVLDHSGHFVPDAVAATEALREMGFVVTPYSAQTRPDPGTGRPAPTGTGNVCVMLPEGYIEILVHTADTAIGQEFRRALAKRAGLHLIAFGVADAAAQHRALEADGLPLRPLVHFSRQIETEAGAREAAFTVARLAEGSMAEGRVQFVQHHAPDALWQPRWTSHPNGAQALAGMVISAPDPAEAAARFGRTLGREPTPHGAGLRISLDSGVLDILPEAQARMLIGEDVAQGTPAFVALRVKVADLAPFGSLPDARDCGGAVAVPFGPALGRGAWLFEAG